MSQEPIASSEIDGHDGNSSGNRTNCTPELAKERNGKKLNAPVVKNDLKNVNLRAQLSLHGAQKQQRHRMWSSYLSKTDV